MKKWDFNEVLMLVDCYSRIAEKSTDTTFSGTLDSDFEKEARKLSAVLRRHEIAQQGSIDKRFRNVPEIKMKLKNIEYLATNGKSGLYNYSSMDKKGYTLYKTDPDRFFELVAALKVAYNAEDIDSDSFDTSDAELDGIPEECGEIYVEEDNEVIESPATSSEDEIIGAEEDQVSSLKDNIVIVPDDIPYCEKYNLQPDDYSNVAIEDVQFSNRVSNCLRRANIFYISDLLRQTSAQLSSVRNFGRKCVAEVEVFIYKLSLTRGGESTILYRNSSGTNFKNYRDSIIVGDFSFADTLELDENGVEQLMRYRDAFDCIGKELSFECTSNPEYIFEIAKALTVFCSEWETLSHRKKILAGLVGKLPDDRAELDAYNFIMAFSRDPAKREKLLSLCPTPGKTLREFASIVPLSDVNTFLLIERFFEWCAFDICSDLNILYEKLFMQPRYRTILEMRAANKTLEATGNAHRLTRERIRQLEIKAKRIFHSWHSRFRLIYKIAALTQGNAALTPVELEEYFGDNTNILIFLLKSVSDSGFCYDEQTDAFYIGEDNFADRLQNVLDELPTIITKNKISEIVCEVSEANDIPEGVIEKAIIDSYRLTGDTYHRNTLTLRMVYESVLEKYYPDGIHVYDDYEIARFREYVQTEYGDIKLSDNNRAISAGLANFCLLCGRGKYKLRNGERMPKPLAEKIYQYIQDSPYSVIMTNTLFSLFEDELCACGIDNKYYLQGSLKDIYGDQFIFRRDYVSKDSSVTNMYMEIVKFIKKSSYPVGKEEIFREFPGISEIVINIAFSDPDVLNFFGSYLHSSNLRITVAEKNYLGNIITKVLADGAIHHIKDFYELVQRDQPDLLQRHGLYIAFSLFSVLEYLYGEYYEFARPYIAPQGVMIDKADDRLKEMVLESDEIAVSDISDFAKENRFVINSMLEYIASFNETHLMRNHDTLATISLLGVNENIAKTVEKLILDEIVEPTPITQLQCVYKLPSINVPWNEWLIYSIIRKWSSKLDIGTSSPQYRYAVPIVGLKGTITKESLEGFSELQQESILQPDNLDDIDDLIADIIFDE